MTLDLRRLGDLTGRVLLFPVRHHSPTAARLVRALAERVRPAAVLVECPFDYNAYLDELYLPHRPPLAIYSYLRLPDGDRRGAFYPLCEHSPEWQAVQVGREIGATVRFIDLPWADIARLDADETSNRFTDAVFRRSAYIAELCRKLGVDDFNTLWDTLFEIDPALPLETYLARCHHLCGHMRLLEAPGRLSDRAREAFMATQIRAALAESDRPVLVVVGGAHCVPLYARLQGIDLGETMQPETFTTAPPEEGEERGIALTPYSFERLDSLAGYEAGMPNPGFYQQVWHDRRRGRQDTHRTLLGRIVEELRGRKQPISSADLIAAETSAVALASLRAHAQVWRTDLVDGLTTSFVKEELNRAGRHPLLEAVHHVLRGGERGLLAAGTRLPPLVHDIQTQLHERGLEPRPLSREVELLLDRENDRPSSVLLHRVRLLEIAGYDRTGGTDLASRDSLVTIWERWRIGWSPDFDARCIEAARYGASLAEAAAAVLGERAAALERDAAAAAALLLDAALAGLTELAWALRQRVGELIRGEGDFFGLSAALGHLLYLYRYDAVLGTAGSGSMAALLREAYSRSLWLLETLGQTAGRDREVIDGVVALRETFERCELSLALDRAELVGVLERVGADREQGTVTRGAAIGAGWSLGAADGEAVRRQLRQFADPDRLGDFLAGLFALAREQVQRHRELVLAVHETVAGWSDDEFLHALPALRLAFTYFTPREKHHLALTLREALGLSPRAEVAALQVDVETVARALALEGRLFALAERVGLRGGDHDGS
ncbi:MAG: DUF5682 family protein [Gemmataceae bacterium]